MSKGKIVKHQEVVRWEIKNPFKGILIGLSSEKDTINGTPPTIAEMIDPARIFIVLRNKLTNMDVFNGRLLDWWRFLNADDRDLILAGSSNSTLRGVAVSDDRIIQNVSLNFDTYDGVYEIEIDMRDSVPSGSRQSSYLFFRPVYSDDAMIYEVIYKEFSLDKIYVDEFLGDGIEEIQVYHNSLVGTAGDLISGISRAEFRSTENSESMDGNLLLINDMSFKEIPQGTLTGYPAQYKLHDGEILTNCSVSFELQASLLGFPYKCMYRKLLPNPNAEASIAKRENRLNLAYNAVENN